VSHKKKGHDSECKMKVCPIQLKKVRRNSVTIPLIYNIFCTENSNNLNKGNGGPAVKKTLFLKISYK
jgi:hypothetical protein